MAKIALFDAKPYDEESFLARNEAFGFDLSFFPVRLGPDTVKLASGFDAVCVFVNDQLDAATIESLSGYGIKVAALRCAGYNNVDLKAAYGKIHLLRVPAYSPHAVAEHAVSLLLCLNRKVHRAYQRTRDGNFAIHGLMGFDLHGKTAGIIGTGKIGRITAEILSGFGMKVLVQDAYPDAAWAESKGFSYRSRAEILASSDVISLHCPLSAETHHLIDAKAIESAKPGLILINTGRGALVDAQALIEGLKGGRIGAAGLDVYEEEDKYFSEDYSGKVIHDDVLARLLGFPNVLVTAHQAFFTEEALRAIADTSLGNLKAFFGGQALENEICYRCGQTQGKCTHDKSGRCFA